MASCLILGGNRFVGLHLVKQLLARGNQVTIFNRGNKLLPPDLAAQVQIIQGDRNIWTDLTQLAEISFDLIFDMCCYEVPQAQMSIDVFGGRIQNYLYISTIAAYKTPTTYPISEVDPLGAWQMWGPYGTQKARTDTFFLDAYHKSKFPVTILRPTYILGPNNHVEREAFFVSRLLAKIPVVIPCDGQALLHFTFVDEVAHALIELSEISNGIGQVYNIATDQAITLEGLVRLIARTLDTEPQIIHADPDRFNISYDPYKAHLISPFANTHVLVSNQKLKAACGLTFEPLVSKLTSSIQWFVENQEKYPVTLRAIESEVLAASGFLPSEKQL